MKALLIIGSFLLAVTLLISCQEQDIEFNRYYAAGATVYQAQCQNCHGDKGQGLAALIPSLTDSVYLKANKQLLACYLQNGLKGKVTIHGKEFEGEMPATILSPKEMAQVLTYVTNSFGNQLGIVNNEMVEKHLAACK